MNVQAMTIETITQSSKPEVSGGVNGCSKFVFSVFFLATDDTFPTPTDREMEDRMDRTFSDRRTEFWMDRWTDNFGIPERFGFRARVWRPSDLRS